MWGAPDDILQKGVHFTVEGTEVSVRPTGRGAITYKKVFGSTSDEAFGQAVSKMKDAMEYNRMRKTVYKRAETGFQKASSSGRGEALEFKKLMRTIKSMGE